MMSNDTGRRLASRALQAAMGVIFLYLVFRNGGLGPSVLGDEWSYSMYSRLLPFSQAQIPSYLYYLVYRSTTMCGADSASCAHVLNAGFFVLSAPFMFMLGRRYMHTGLALLLTVATMLSPVSTYTAFFMPEAMYFFLFWLLAWLVLARMPTASATHGAIVGVVLGVIVLVKLHGLFLLAAYGLYLISMSLLTRHERGWTATSQAICCALATCLGVRLLGGFCWRAATACTCSADSTVLRRTTASAICNSTSFGTMRQGLRLATRWP